MPPSNATPAQDEQLPQTTTVFSQPQLQVNEHEWVQQGYYIMDACNPHKPNCHSGGIPIPSGKTLVKQGGKYDLVSERSE